MKPVDIDFLPPRRPPSWAWRLLGAMGLCLLAALVMLGWRLQVIRELEAEVQTLQDQVLQASQAMTLPVPSAVVPWVPALYDTDARHALREGRFTAAEALVQMERATIPGVTPSSMELDVHAGRVQVQVTFKNQEALFAYLEALNRQEGGQEGAGAPARWKLLQARPTAGESSQGMAVIVSYWKS